MIVYVRGCVNKERRDRQFWSSSKTMKRDLEEIELYLEMNSGNSLQLEQDDKNNKFICREVVIYGLAKKKFYH